MRKNNTLATAVATIIICIVSLTASAGDIVYTGHVSLALNHVAAYSNTGKAIFDPTQVNECRQYFTKTYGSTHRQLNIDYHIDMTTLMMRGQATLGGGLYYVLHPLGTSSDITHFLQFRSDSKTPAFFFEIRLSDKQVKAETMNWVTFKDGGVLCTLGNLS